MEHERRLLRHRPRVGLPGGEHLVRVVHRRQPLGRAVERDRLQLRAEPLLDEEGPVVGVVAEVEGVPGGVRPAEQIGLVLAAVVAPRRAVAVGEPAHRRHQVEVLVARELGPVHRDERLVDPEVRLHPPVAGIGEVVRGDLDGRLDPVVAVVEIELGPGGDQAVGVAPVDVVGVGDHGRRAELRPGVAAVRVGGGGRPPRHAERRPEVTGHVELPLRARLGDDDGRGLGRRRDPPAHLRRLRRQPQRRSPATPLLGFRRGRGRGGRLARRRRGRGGRRRGLGRRGGGRRRRLRPHRQRQEETRDDQGQLERSHHRSTFA